MSRVTKQRGSVIIYTLLIVSALLAIGLGLTNLFIIKIRNVSRQRATTDAIYAADSAAELCLYEARTGANYNDPASTMNDGTLDNGAMFTIEDLGNPGTFIEDDCSVLGSGSFSFRATGTYRNVSRALEISQ